MQIIPIHYKVSERVRRYSQIEQDAEEMKKMLDRRGFHGHHNAGYALAHAQVSENPFSFFVVDQALIEDGSYKERVIINPKILKAPYHIDAKMLDGSLGKKPNAKEYAEGCLSFPYRRQKRLNRFDRIKVAYRVKSRFWGLKRRTRWLDGLASQVFQHEFDHCNGQNIFFDSPK
jgi:peptide deformylase